jgi:hypothetical protein
MVTYLCVLTLLYRGPNLCHDVGYKGIQFLETILQQIKSPANKASVLSESLRAVKWARPAESNLDIETAARSLRELTI